MSKQQKVLVIGSGMAGLACAKRLSAIAPATAITIVDKGRSLGGRMAARTEDEYTWNYGAHQVHCPKKGRVREHLRLDKDDEAGDKVATGLEAAYDAFRSFIQPFATQMGDETYLLKHSARDTAHALRQTLPTSVGLFQAVRVTGVTHQLTVDAEHVSGGPESAASDVEWLKKQQFNAVVVTAPCEQMVAMTPAWPRDTMDALSRVQYNSMACAMFRNKGLTGTALPDTHHGFEILDPLGNGAVLARTADAEFIGMSKDKRALLSAIVTALPSNISAHLQPFRAHVWKYSTVRVPLWRAAAPAPDTTGHTGEAARACTQEGTGMAGARAAAGWLEHPQVPGVVAAGDWLLGATCADAFVSGTAAADQVAARVLQLPSVRSAL